MEKELETYDTAKLIFSDEIYKYKFKDMLKIRKYLLLLKTIEKEQNKLDYTLRDIAISNEIVTAYVVYIELGKAVKENQELAMSIIDKEIIRLQEVINNYKTGKLSYLSYKEVESILKEYATDDIFLYAMLRFLYEDEMEEEKNKVLLYSNNE